MMEPRRLLNQGATDAERALLSSARADGPPAGAAQRMFVALQGLAPGDGSLGSTPGLPSAGAPIAAHSIKTGVLAKVAVIGLVGLGAVGAGLLVHRVARRPAARIETAATRAAPVALAAPIPGESPAASEASDLAASGPAGTPRAREASPADQSLSAEIRVLDAARAAVDARNPAAAQRALETYGQRFPQGHLKPEATVLRLAVLVLQGHRTAARSLAAQLLASESYKAYQHRIRSLLREAGGEQPEN